MPLMALSGGNTVLCSPFFEIDLEIPKSGLAKKRLSIQSNLSKQDGEHQASERKGDSVFVGLRVDKPTADL